MHMITYVTSISMQPKRIVCGVYRGTQTLDNLMESREFVLQLLSADQYKLTKILGKTSGKNRDFRC
jgi:flavin reductase (DIM6/NTAB) family NADH-FMN oxidoreductase RutF